MSGLVIRLTAESFIKNVCDMVIVRIAHAHDLFYTPHSLKRSVLNISTAVSDAALSLFIYFPLYHS